MTDKPPESHVASHVFNLVVMVLGALGLAWMLHELGWSYLADAIQNIGWWFAVILALDVGALCCDAAALRAFMRPEARMVSYLRVLAAQASGRAINVLTPTGALGEPTKLAMLITHAPRDRVLSSLVIQNLAQFYLSVTVITIGTPIMFLLVDVPHAIKVMVAIGFAVIIPVMVAIAIVIRRGAIKTVVATIRRTRLISAERSARWCKQMIEVDHHIRELQENRSYGTWKGFLWVGASKLVNWTGTLVLISTAGIDINAALIVGILSIGVLIQWVSAIVPMGLGLADGGNYALYDLTTSSGAHGVVVTVLNRVRSVGIAILGLGAMAATHAVNRMSVARMHRKLRELRAQQADHSS